MENVDATSDDEVLVDPLARKWKIGKPKDILERPKWIKNDEKWFKKIYSDRGWPGERFRNEEALAEVPRQWKKYCDMDDVEW